MTGGMESPGLMEGMGYLVWMEKMERMEEGEGGVILDLPVTQVRNIRFLQITSECYTK